jgi:hypothetical protein
VVRAWDLGSGPMALLAKCLKVLNTLSEMGTAVRGFTITPLRVAASGSPPECMREAG